MLSSQNCSWFTSKWTSHPAWSLNPGDERVVHGQSAAGSEHEDLGEQEEEQGGGEQQHGWTTSGEGGVADTLVSVWAFWRKVGRQNISSFKGRTYINQADPGDFRGNCCCGSFFANFAKDTIYSLQSDENNPKANQIASFIYIMIELCFFSLDKLTNAMRDKDRSTLREMFQYSSLVKKPLGQCEIARHWGEL